MCALIGQLQDGMQLWEVFLDVFSTTADRLPQPVSVSVGFALSMAVSVTTEPYQ